MAEVAIREARAAAAKVDFGNHREEDSEAVLRRTWTDIDFDGGEVANNELVKALETEFAAQLAGSMPDTALRGAGEAGGEGPGDVQEAASCILGTDEAAMVSENAAAAVLDQSQNLGASLDMIGVYLKNYITDKADMVLRRIMPFCRRRGGFWLIKALNIAACVCSKQGRHEEALAALEELQALVTARLGDFNCDETVAWAFYDMVYKNLGWTLEALGRNLEAFGYFERAVKIKRANGVAPTWFDQWDLGKALARMAAEQRDAGELRRAGGLLREALQMQQRADPDDAVTRGKLLKSVGDCHLALGELAVALQGQREDWAEAQDHLQAARGCFLVALGASSPLTGAASESLACALLRLRRWKEAREMLQQALHCECCKDTIELPKAAEIVDGLLGVHRALDHGDRPGQKCYEADLLLGLTNLRRRCVDQAAPLCFAALLLGASRLLGPDGALLQEAVACLQLVWEEGPNMAPDPTLALPIFQLPLGPDLVPPRAQKQSFPVTLEALLPELEVAVAELHAMHDTGRGADVQGNPAARYQTLD